ncbi:RagB/SusD family nutrient uptake outer membrane protein [Adhaeribacter radiodurans]|uniref:RagB/SusD family nutrient uptake outer membrane protein n=1 Tax=Adhaeribacter radiodurans TaxID=2745197 RepID=A0A7L7L2U5_9BACT|nr:RagB/SusD family nutrient uptake outer membrane protein [Adhaeribacter radiodurans]QMU27080.1 RagB/SusD family nutrient uptake outer membrane protein [Adhaeribacter radiodurans]
MKKNNFLIGLLVTFAAATFTSCTDFLDETNRNDATANTFYATAEGMEAVVNSCYTPTRTWYGKTIGHLLTEAGTDEMLYGNTAGNTYPHYTYNALLQGANTNGTGLYFVWKSFYKGINACNTAIGRMALSPITENLKLEREAEARFLRAFYYYHLVEIFGPIPLRLQETVAPELTATRAPVDEVYNQIIEDLTFAYTNLSGKITPAGGRVIQPAVAALLARVYLTLNDNTNALLYATKVIKDYDFALNNDYKAIWDIGNSNGTTNKEVIWFVNYAANNVFNDYGRYDDLGYFWLWEGGNHSHMHYLPFFVGVKGYTGTLETGRALMQYMPSKYLLNLYDETKDARFNGSFRTVWFANDPTTLPADKKLGDTIVVVSKKPLSAEYKASKPYTIYDIDDIYDVNGLPKEPRQRYPALWKFHDPTRATVNVVESKRDAFVFRLAEMYLIAAEASLKLNNTGEAANFVNAIRERAALPGKVEDMRVTAADINLDFILEERAREFAGEQLRWFDLKRTGKLVERVKMYNPDAAPNIQEYHNLRPIPQIEIDVLQNKSEFTQNPGYN